MSDRYSFNKVSLVCKDVQAALSILALVAVAACGHHDDASENPPPPLAPMSQTDQPVSTPKPTPTPGPTPASALLSHENCVVNLTSDFSSTHQRAEASERYHLVLEVNNDGGYQLFIRGVSCSTIDGNLPCKFFEDYTGAVWKPADTNVLLNSAKGGLFGYLMMEDNGKEARLSVLDTDFLSMGFPDVIYFNVPAFCKAVPNTSAK